MVQQDAVARPAKTIKFITPKFCRFGGGGGGGEGTHFPIDRRYVAGFITINLFSFTPEYCADPDPYVFGPPGSGSVSQRYASGSF
jgi:hypothetical protein